MHIYNKILGSDGLGYLMEKLQNLGSSASLLYIAEQGGRVIDYSLIKEEGLMTFGWANTRWANLNGEEVSGGKQCSDSKDPEEERYNEHFLHTPTTYVLGPTREDFAISMRFIWGRLCHSHGVKALESLTWQCLSQHTPFTQGFLCYTQGLIPGS